jgi:hypothetical protein
MAANDFLRPNELLARCKNLPRGGNDNPQCDASGNEGIENRIAGQGDEKAGGDWRGRHVDIADIVNIGQPDGRIVVARL